MGWDRRALPFGSYTFLAQLVMFTYLRVVVIIELGVYGVRRDALREIEQELATAILGGQGAVAEEATRVVGLAHLRARGRDRLLSECKEVKARCGLLFIIIRPAEEKGGQRSHLLALVVPRSGERVNQILSQRRCSELMTIASAMIDVVFLIDLHGAATELEHLIFKVDLAQAACLLRSCLLGSAKDSMSSLAVASKELDSFRSHLLQLILLLLGDRLVIDAWLIPVEFEGKADALDALSLPESPNNGQIGLL